ncbi:MAG: hypothetical protein HYY76_14735 [Acidobacteria bacterium]|nr:hypothetical protein [Acidobacteriota bacterium]
MTEIIATVASAINIVSRLKAINDRIRDAEFQNVLADLNIELAEAKIQVAELLSENRDLKQRIRELEKADDEPCPKCRQRTWRVEDSKADGVFGVVGATRRTYKCWSCGLTEQRLMT